MTTATIQRDLQRIVKKHEEIGADLRRLLQRPNGRVEDWNLPYGDEELSAAAKRRIRQAEKDIAAGKCITLRSKDELRRYFASMRQ